MDKETLVNKYLGYNKVTDILEKLNGGELVLIGSTPSIGKTTFALSLANYLIKNHNHKSCFFSLEMSKEALEKLITENALNIDKGYFDIIDKAGLTITELTDILDKKVKQENIKFCFIDYLGLLVNDNPKQDIGELVNALKSLALNLNIFIIVLVQINGKYSGIRLEMDHFNTFESIADIIITLFKNNENMKTELIVLK